MKRIFRKNQIMVTALALMLAVAGYFSFMGENMNNQNLATQTNADALEETFEISDEDILNVEDIFVAEELIEWDTTETMETDVASNVSESGTEAGVEVANEIQGSVEEELNPGEAVLTNSTVANIDYASEMKMSREQVRSKSKETLLEIINNTSIDDSIKQDAVNKMIAMTEIAERENAAEMLLEAKGFTDVVVSITEDACDVVLNMGEVTDAKRAQVEDIVKRKTNITSDKIVITPIIVNENE